MKYWDQDKKYQEQGFDAIYVKHKFFRTRFSKNLFSVLLTMLKYWWSSIILSSLKETQCKFPTKNQSI